MNDIVKQIISDILLAGATTIIGIASFYLKKFINSHMDLIEHKKEILKEQLGTEQYNKNKLIVKDVIGAVEQMGKEFDWQGAFKHSKATEIIKSKTGLSDDDIYNLIKSVVGELNKDKEKTTPAAQ